GDAGIVQKITLAAGQKVPRDLLREIRGKDGSMGGTGAPGGAAGNGGNGGVVILKSKEPDMFYCVSVDVKGGLPGEGGFSGKGGEGGEPGEPGMLTVIQEKKVKDKSTTSKEGTPTTKQSTQVIKGKPGAPGKTGVESQRGCDGDGGRDGKVVYVHVKDSTSGDGHDIISKSDVAPSLALHSFCMHTKRDDGVLEMGEHVWVREVEVQNECGLSLGGHGADSGATDVGGLGVSITLEESNKLLDQVEAEKQRSRHIAPIDKPQREEEEEEEEEKGTDDLTPVEGSTKPTYTLQSLLSFPHPFPILPPSEAKVAYLKQLPPTSTHVYNACVHGRVPQMCEVVEKSTIDIEEIKSLLGGERVVGCGFEISEEGKHILEKYGSSIPIAMSGKPLTTLPSSILSCSSNNNHTYTHTPFESVASIDPVLRVMGRVAGKCAKMHATIPIKSPLHLSSHSHPFFILSSSPFPIEVSVQNISDCPYGFRRVETKAERARREKETKEKVIRDWEERKARRKREKETKRFERETAREERRTLKEEDFITRRNEIVELMKKLKEDREKYTELRRNFELRLKKKEEMKEKEEKDKELKKLALQKEIEEKAKKEEKKKEEEEKEKKEEVEGDEDKKEDEEKEKKEDEEETKEEDKKDDEGEEEESAEEEKETEDKEEEKVEETDEEEEEEKT
ncbi:hypothetical protein ADUPG1_011170, partial [Aduncisulcus paluster]